MSDFTNLTASSTAIEAKSPRPVVQTKADHRRFEFWRVFGSTFITIFLAELGDKTQVTTLLMSAGSQAPWVVFLGAGSALIATSLIGVLLGKWLSRRLSSEAMDTAVGSLLLGITVWLLWDVAQF